MFVFRNCISIQITKCIFQKSFPARTPGKPCLCHGSPCSIAGCATFAKSSLLEILLFCWHEQLTSSVAQASLGRFFFTVVWSLSGSTQIIQDSMSKHIFVIVILSQLESISVVYIFYTAMFAFIYWVSSSPQQLLVVLFIAFLQSGR